ncbi:MAG TPA: hypothetical protein VGP28_05450 [Methylocella sp.]|jgi:hypothetical protein|nr:hypothetical protein [Methylocella sp.]
MAPFSTSRYVNGIDSKSRGGPAFVLDDPWHWAVDWRAGDAALAREGK